MYNHSVRACSWSVLRVGHIVHAAGSLTQQSAFTGHLAIATDTAVGTYTIPLYGTGVIGTLAAVTPTLPAGTYAGTQSMGFSTPGGATTCFR